MTIPIKLIANLMIETAGIVICISALIALMFGTFRSRITKRYMFFALLNMFIYNLCLLLLEFTQAGVLPAWRPLVIALGFGTYLFPQACTFFVSIYIARTVSMTEGQYVFRAAMLYVVLILQLTVILVLQFLQMLLVVDSDGIFHYGKANWIGFVFVAIFMLADLLFLVRYSDNISRMERYGFSAYLALPILTIFIRGFFPGIYVVALSSCVSMLIMLSIILNGQSETIRRQELDNEHLKVDIMLSQIQPHFMFNVLYVIQEICLIDSKTASEAISDFSRYLRHNMDSISINTPIPFKEELEHVKHYVSLQQLRFGDALNVQYDLGCTDFDLPTLTMQPLVENAIRYGVRKSEDGSGTVIIRTIEYDEYYKIHVIDDGPGFLVDQLPDGGSSHMGLKNVRERLKRISGGELIIDSRLGKGTDAMIIVPKETNRLLNRSL